MQSHVTVISDAHACLRQVPARLWAQGPLINPKQHVHVPIVVAVVAVSLPKAMQSSIAMTKNPQSVEF